jgi:16S rRNA (cytidine1402-2'-O)-methyltransferase
MGESGCLFLVATPIGNLGDLTDRGKKVLSECDLIACEDTRVTKKLLANLELSKPMISYREENEKRQSGILAEEILKGQRVALLSDAGYPGISDPGFRLVRECRKQNIQVVPIPGPNAAITALAASGLPTHHFLFLGFPPKGKVAFENLLQKWEDFEGSLIFYQSKYKMESTLEILKKVYGEQRFLAVARELTKLHESIVVGTISSVQETSLRSSQKGEFTLVIAPSDYVL